MKREKTIQIPLTLFTAIAKYFFLDLRDFENENKIKKGIKTKVDACNRHELYCQFKTGTTPEAKEKARQEYLNAAGIPNSFRWPEGYDNAR